MPRHTVIALALLIGCCFARMSFAQNRFDPATLFQQLNAVETTDGAKETLSKEGAEDAQIREYLRTNLPPMIDIGYKKMSPQWVNAVRLAGELKIVEAAPALAKWIGLDSVGETSAGMYQRLETNPPAKALSQIGDPAIPALANVLGHGTLRERRAAYFALNLINSPLSRAAIHSRDDREDDPSLRDFIQKTPK